MQLRLVCGSFFTPHSLSLHSLGELRHVLVDVPLVQIADGNASDFDNVIFAYCGLLDGTPAIVTSQTNTVRILFSSNDIGNFPGFDLSYERFLGLLFIVTNM